MQGDAPKLRKPVKFQINFTILIYVFTPNPYSLTFYRASALIRTSASTFLLFAFFCKCEGVKKRTYACLLCDPTSQFPIFSVTGWRLVLSIWVQLVIFFGNQSLVFMVLQSPGTIFRVTGRNIEFLRTLNIFCDCPRKYKVGRKKSESTGKTAVKLVLIQELFTYFRRKNNFMIFIGFAFIVCMYMPYYKINKYLFLCFTRSIFISSASFCIFFLLISHFFYFFRIILINHDRSTYLFMNRSVIFPPS